MENQNFNSDLKKISIAGSKLISIYYWIVSLVIITIFKFFQVKYNVLPSLINTILPIFELIIYIFILRNLLSAGRNLEYAFTIPNKNLEIPLSSSEYYQELSENFNNDSSIVEIRNSCPGCTKDINETDKECPTCGLSLNN
jgi:hypothetical protein